eukprot:scaffold267311_cov30-Tisochrysis_lutea.AAC.3
MAGGRTRVVSEADAWRPFARCTVHLGILDSLGDLRLDRLLNLLDLGLAHEACLKAVALSALDRVARRADAGNLRRGGRARWVARRGAVMWASVRRRRPPRRGCGR